MDNTTLFLSLALIVFLISGHVVISRLEFEGTEVLKVKFSKSKTATINQPFAYLSPEITVVENTTIIKLRDTIRDTNDSETFTIEPSQQVIKMKNINVQVYVDLIYNTTMLKGYDEDYLFVRDSNQYSAFLKNNRGILKASYDQQLAFMMCSQKALDVLLDRDAFTVVTRIFRIDYNRRLEIIKLGNIIESVRIDLKHRYIEDREGKNISGDNPAWKSSYGSVVFNDNSVLIVYEGVNVTINLLTKPYTLVMSSLEGNLTETPTNMTLECDVGKIIMNNHLIELNDINGEKKGTKSQFFLNDYYGIITKADQSALIVKSQKDLLPLSIMGMYGSIKVHSNGYKRWSI